MDVVGEPVQQRSGQPLRPEDLAPLVEGQVGGDQDVLALIALAENLEEEFADDTPSPRRDAHRYSSSLVPVNGLEAVTSEGVLGPAP